MKAMLVAVGAIAALVVPGAQAGGSFERIVAVGAGGAWRTIELAPSGMRSQSALTGQAVGAPTGGYVRLYSFIGNLPAEPGRFYPAENVSCITWSTRPAACVRLGAAGAALLAPLRGLALRRDQLTAPVRVSYRGHVLPYANGNVFAAFELAYERFTTKAVTARDGISLTVAWRGPAAAERPRTLLLTPAGIVTGGRLRPLGRGIWCYLVLNVPDRLKSYALDAAIAAERC